MVKKEVTFKGKSTQELQALSMSELTALLPAPARRKIKNGFTQAEQIFLKNMTHAKGPVKTHCRDMVILPNMIGKRIQIHKGNSFQEVYVELEMVGHRLGEFALTRKKVTHSVAGVGSKAAAPAAATPAAPAKDAKDAKDDKKKK